MQYGAMNFPILPVLEEIETISRLGFDYLELAMDPPMAHHGILSANRADIAKALQDGGLGLVCHLPTFVSTADLTESLRLASVMEMRRSLDAAFDLGAKKVVLHPSIAGGMGAFVPATTKAYAFDFLTEMVEAARNLSISVCLENMFPRNRLGVLPEDFDEIFKLFPSLKLTLDTGHANIDSPRQSRLMELAERFGDRIGHLHFSDNRGKRDDHLPVGGGSVDFAGLVRHLKKIGYDDTLTLEVFDDDRQKLVESRQRIEALFAGR